MEEKNRDSKMKILTRLVAIGVVIISIISVSIYVVSTRMPDPKENAIECAKQIIWDHIENTSSITFPWRKNKWDISQTGDTFHAIVNFDTVTFYNAPAKKTASVYFTVTGMDADGGWTYLVDDVSILDMKAVQGARPVKAVKPTEEAKPVKKERERNKNTKTSFKAAKKRVDQSVKKLNLDKMTAVKSWRTEVDKEVYYLEIIMDEKVFRGMYQNQNNEWTRQAWKNMREEERKFTKAANEYFRSKGFDTAVVINMMNPFNTNNMVLSMCNGMVTYDMMNQ